MSVRVPSLSVPMVNEDRTPSNAWASFFQDLVGPSQAIQPVALTGSPFTYTAPDDGHVHVSGGTVTALSLIRGRVSLTTGISGGFIPVSAGDALAITYSAAPTVNFVPA